MRDQATTESRAFLPPEQAESILRHVADAITVQAPDGRLLYANDAAVRALGFATADELLDAPLSALMSKYELLSPDGTPLPLEQLPGRLALSGIESEQLVRYRIQDTGEERWALVRGTPVHDDDGRVAYAINIFRDVTDAQRAEERQHAAVALEYVADGVFLLDADGVVRFWNPAAEAITGLAPAQVVGRAAGEAIAGWADIAERVAAAPEGRPVSVPLELDGREIWLSIGAVRFADGTVFAFRDLTEERGLEQLKSEFISTVSHELRTPLAAIYGASRTLLRGDIELAEEQRGSLLEVIGNEADRLARIVNDILWASRLDSGSLRVTVERCDARELVREVVDAARVHLPDRITLAVWDTEPLPPICADPDKVRQVLANLLDNAAKYSPDGGVIEVRLAARGNAVRFSVDDEGLGIPVVDQRRIFEKFYRVDPDLRRGIGGTGLGLYICRELVRRMRGDIWVRSREGEGSTFAFELPLATRDPGDGTEPPPGGPA
ncbi:MAG TPA: ATP-binding protein [Gaiellaceae bacterium]|nr:ATP-binding protein [Gaiellaceae bacterium]